MMVPKSCQHVWEMAHSTVLMYPSTLAVTGQLPPHPHTVGHMALPPITTLSPLLLVPQPMDNRMVVDWCTPSRVEVLRHSVTRELMGRGSEWLLIIFAADYTASAYSETGALPVSALYGIQGIAELDPSKYTSTNVMYLIKLVLTCCKITLVMAVNNSMTINLSSRALVTTMSNSGSYLVTPVTSQLCNSTPVAHHLLQSRSRWYLSVKYIPWSMLHSLLTTPHRLPCLDMSSPWTWYILYLVAFSPDLTLFSPDLT